MNHLIHGASTITVLILLAAVLSAINDVFTV
jgi:hypothetical protein